MQNHIKAFAFILVSIFAWVFRARAKRGEALTSWATGNKTDII